MAFVVDTHGAFKCRDDNFDPAVGPPYGLKHTYAATKPATLNKLLFGAAPPRRGKTALSVEQGLILRLAARAAASSVRAGAVGLFDRTLRHSEAKGMLAAQVYREISHACIVRSARAALTGMSRHRQEMLAA